MIAKPRIQYVRVSPRRYHEPRVYGEREVECMICGDLFRPPPQKARRVTGVWICPTCRARDGRV